MGVAAGGAAVALRGEAAEGAAPPIAEQKPVGYRETAHVKKFYDTARF